MPELPEVETIRADLQKLIVGKKITQITSDSLKQVQPSLGVVEKAIVGTKIVKVARRAKLLQIFLDNGKILIIHLKLTGRLLFRQKNDVEDQWTHVVISFDDQTELRFADSRKFGYMKLIENEKDLQKILSGFGPEPLNDLTLEIFKQILKKNSRAVKIILMDQTKISGIGNIYSCEALFLAHIDPQRPAKSLTEKEMENLFDQIEKVLKLGLKYRGASDQYYLDAYGQKGEYQKHFLVYGKKGEDCPNSCGGKIKRIVVGGRGTFYCPACQR
jgi:formamidopyrimidine-DNA glycosylase